MAGQMDLNGEESFRRELEELKRKISTTYLPPDLHQRALSMVERLIRTAKYGGYAIAYENLTRYLDWITDLPWRSRTQDHLDLSEAKKILDQHHYGLAAIKERLLEYLAVLQLHRKQITVSDHQGDLIEGQGTDITSAPGSQGVVEVISRAPILLFVGLVGTGKTTLAYSIATAMGRKIARIPFGGMGEASQIRGQSRAEGEAEPGQVIKALRRSGSKNPVILLDEIDRVADETRSDIMGVLVELLDPEQNQAFVDHYIDYPFDLSEVLFVATCNNTTNIATAVLDRLEPIQMPSYTDQEKIAIAKDYILPKVMEGAGLNKNILLVDEEVWPLITRPLGFDAGIRTLERTIQSVCRKIAKLYVEGQGKRFTISKENVKEFIPSW